MSFFVDRSYQIRISFCQPTEHEEGSPYPIQVEQIQQSLHLFLYPARIFIPILFVDEFGKSFNLKILLDIDGKGIPHRMDTVVSHFNQEKFGNGGLMRVWEGNDRPLKRDVYLAPRPRMTIFMVWKRIIRSSFNDMFLM